MKLRTLIFFVFSLGFLTVNGQDESVRRPHFQTKTSLVYYYFWEENEDGSVRQSVIHTPFSLNRVILIDTLRSAGKCTLSDSVFMREIELIGRNYKQKKISYTKRKSGNKLAFGIIRPTDPIAVIYIKRKGRWSSFTSGLVLYFDVYSNTQLFFRSESNEIRLMNQKPVRITNNTYRVYTHFNSDNIERKHPNYQHLFAFKGEELSRQIILNQVPEPQRYLVFVNGYRGPRYDKQESRNEVYMNDRTNYWFKIDDRFIKRLNPDTSFYMDGSFSVKTSNHRSKLRFGWSFVRATRNSKRCEKKFKRLNQDCNPEGFEYRYQKGLIAGKAFLNEIMNTPNSYLTADTIDIVCHSMGYAYTLGLLETLKNRIVLGKIYMLAPENASYDGMDWNLFEEAWQYGSNLGEENSDPLCFQDGVAPQTAVCGIDSLQSECIGRIFSPANWPNKHFVHSHMVYSYDWIFDRIKKGQPGYIH